MNDLLQEALYSESHEDLRWRGVTGRQMGPCNVPEDFQSGRILLFFPHIDRSSLFGMSGIESRV